MIISKQYYSDMTDYLHPNIHRFIERYTYPEDNFYFLPPYHSCGKKTSKDKNNSLIIEVENNALLQHGNKQK